MKQIEYNQSLLDYIINPPEKEVEFAHTDNSEPTPDGIVRKPSMKDLKATVREQNLKEE